MPNRILRDGILTSDRVAKLSWPAEVFYRRLMSVVDDFGRFDGRTTVIRAAAYPLLLTRVKDEDILAWMKEVEAANLIKRYAVAGKPYLVLLDFRQQVRAKRSKFPEPLSTCVADAQHMIAYAHLDGDESESVVGDGGESTRTRDAGQAVILDKAEAVEQTAFSGVAKDFAEYVYDDWATRMGKDASGCNVPWLPYCTKRWNRERQEWLNGTHVSKRTNGTNRNPNQPRIDRNKGTHNETYDHAGAQRLVR